MLNRLAATTAVGFCLALIASAEDAKAPHPLEPFYGEWVGTAEGYGPGGVPFKLTQTERVGPMLGGDVAVIEGRGYKEDGSLAFNAFAVVSCFEHDAPCEMRSYTEGRTGTFELVPGEASFVWTIPAGPGAKVVYSATLEDGVWTEIGHYHPAEGEPRQTIRMELRRVGDTDWPAGDAVLPPEE